MSEVTQTYNRNTTYLNRSLEYFFHREMYTQCAQHSLNNDKAEKPVSTTYCDTFISIGGIVALLTIPTVWVGLWGNFILILALVSRIRRSAKQEVYGIFFAVIDTLNLVYTGIVINFGSKGLPWLGFDGFYVEYANPLTCKFSRFLRVFLNTFSINMIFCESLGRVIMIKSRGAHNPKREYVIYTLFIAMIISIIHASPVVIIYNLKIPDGRYDCINDSGWPEKIVNWEATHRFLFCDGAVQAIFSLIFNVYNIIGLFKLRATIEYIEHTAKESNIVSDTLKQITRLLNNIERDTKVVVMHTTIVSFLFILKGIFSYKLYSEVFKSYEDNNKVQGVLKNYSWTSIEDIIVFIYFLFISCHMWLYYFLIPPFRSYIRDMIQKVTFNNESVLKVVDMFMLTETEAGDTPEWRKSQNYLQNLDPVLYERIRQLEGALKQTEYATDKH